jgi:hypothetical protein
MPKLDRLLERGISFVKAGQEENARSLLKAVIHEDPHNQFAWGWYVQSFRDGDARLQAFDEYLECFPQDQQAHTLRMSLLEKQKAQWEQLASDAFQELDWVKAESSQKLDDQRQMISLTRALLVVITLVLVSIIFMVNHRKSKKIDSLASQVNSLIYSYDLLETDYDILHADYVDINQQYNTLQNEHAAIVQKHDALLNDHSTLIANHQVLTEEYNALLENFDNLSGEHESLKFQHEELNRIAVKPPYILIQDRSIDTVFYDLDGSLITWVTPFSHLEYFLERGHDLRNDMMNRNMYSYIVYTDDGRKLGIRDFTVFYDTNSYSKVLVDIFNRTDSADDFINQVWQIIVQLNNYTAEEYETPRFPSETLFAGGGDCEDLSILFASLIKTVSPNWYVDLVYVDSDNILNPRKHDHVLVYIDTGQRTYLVETTSDTNMEPYTNGVRGWLGSRLSSDDINDRYPVTLH